MIKILNTAQIRDADAYTILKEPISSILLMERAANAFVQQFIQEYPDKNKAIRVICGSGNNGGDGLAITRLLAAKKYEVHAYIFPSEKYSEDCLHNLKKLRKEYKKSIYKITSADFISELSPDTIIIDAIFGTGLNKPILQGSLAFNIIDAINKRAFKNTIAVDTPSGLFADKNTTGISVNATKTYTFQFPKLAFLFPKNSNNVGSLKILNIQLHPDFIQQVTTTYFLTEGKDISAILKPRPKFSHKGTFGHALIIAGSYGKMGAAILSSKSALRSGAGLVSAYIPTCGYEVFQTAFPEAMCMTDKQQKQISTIPNTDNYTAVAIGPGIGTSKTTSLAFIKFIKQLKRPIIIDADALNILSVQKSLLKYLPQKSILTPHPKEFERLVGKWSNDFERLKLQQDFSKKYQVIIILKGAHTSITDIDGSVYFNTTGNAGMATGGSGDVLTGILVGLLAQGYTPTHAAITGVYIHGLAGDLALQTQSMESLIASDIIEHLGFAFKAISNL